jgi:hypothetical protein
MAATPPPPLPSPGGEVGAEHMCGLESREPWEPHQFSFFGFFYFILFYWPQKRSSWIANAWEIFAARPRPSLCKIRKFSSISRFEHESQKKITSMPRPRPRFRPRFSDLSFHLQPCLDVPVTRTAHAPSVSRCLEEKEREKKNWSRWYSSWFTGIIAQILLLVLTKDPIFAKEN